KKIFLKKIQTLLYKFSLPLANKILFLNADDYRDLILENNIRIKDFEVIGGIGVNLKNYTYMQPDISAIHFGMVSRLLIEKGVREFVEAARFVKTIYPQVKFSIAGAVDDNPGGISREQVATWEKEGVVKFLGQVSDINEYLSNINIFVLPSYREGIPRSTQEAMAMGLPVITTDVPGCRETVKNEVNGLVVPPWDAEALVEAMTFFIANPEKIIAMGKQSRIMAEEKFDENEATSKLLRVFFN
ncbi:glycosyltransferase family 1 protein, partial [Salmonella enterica subsp. salamae]|nr:glycosyltransferase family 1 protein [Salmonella enterica subsp. salamae]